MRNVKMRFVLIATSIVFCAGLTACDGNHSDKAGSNSEVVSGSAVSAGAVSGVLPVEKQLTVIAENERMWNMGAEEPVEDEWNYIDSFNYAVTDLDQDGFLEVLTYVQQGTGCYTDYEMYEVDETGRELIKWEIRPDEAVEEKSVMADLAEYPMEVYFDERTGSYHYESLDHIHWSAVEGEDYLVDIEIKDNTIMQHIITYVHYKPDKEHCTEEDFEMTYQYYDSNHKKISKKESEELEKSYWKGMKKQYMFFCSEYVESKQLKKMERDKLEGRLENSRQGFFIKKIEEDTGFEKSLSKDMKKQLKTILEKYELGDFGNSEKKIWFAITDLNDNGRLEFVFYPEDQERTECQIYEVSDSGKKLKKKKSRELVSSQAEWEELMTGGAVCGWRQARGEDIYRMSSWYLYKELVESWRQFQVQ